MTVTRCLPSSYYIVQTIKEVKKCSAADVVVDVAVIDVAARGVVIGVGKITGETTGIPVQMKDAKHSERALMMGIG